MLKFFLTGLLWGLVAILAIPSALIIISWNAIPGDSNYGLKVGLEKVLLGVAPSDNLKATLQIKYTERRFDEVEKVISTDYAHQSLESFNSQLIASKDSVQKIENTEEKSVQTQSLITTLEKVSQKIDQKEQITITPIKTVIPTKIITPTRIITPTKIITAVPTQIPPTSAPTIIPTIVSDTPSIQPDISQELDETKEKIKEVIEELKKSQNQEKDSDKKDNRQNKNNDFKPDNSQSDYSNNSHRQNKN